MKIITETLTLPELNQLAAKIFGNLVKAVVDVDRELIAVDAELHSDLEAALLAGGSKQENLWGINLYPETQGDGFVEFDSLINIRPSYGNKSRGVEDPATRQRILEIVTKRVKR